LTTNNASVKIEAMNDEQTGLLVGRAAKHAALADVVRLQIVDLLATGDLSPGELRLAVGIESNLLAHHLNVLEAAGLVVRSRSEADRRRSYVRLLDTPAASPVAGAPVAERVVFVCTANSARSQLAAALWQQASEVPAVSAGTHPAATVAPGAIAAAQRHHLPFTPVAPSTLSPSVLGAGDLVITVCDRAHEELDGTDRLHWSVPDPVPVGSDEAFDLAFDDLAHRIDDLAVRLMSA
jgi:protein-tyrosine-phosphatase/DNA-binding transcriptional ArsR family regulator